MPSFDNETGLYSFDEDGELVDLEICQSYSLQVEPVAMEECNEQIPCPVRYLPGQFQEVKIKFQLVSTHTHILFFIV